MWRTPKGERTLRGPEWELFREGLGLLKDQVETTVDDPDWCNTGIDVFDRLTEASKLAMLALVGKALHDEAAPCPELTALTEGTFAAVFAAIRGFIEFEIDLANDDPTHEEDESSLRSLVLAAFREVNPEWDGSLPAPDCEDMDRWDFVLGEVTDHVLWDRDFEDEALFLDSDPGRNHNVKAILGITANYFTAVAPDPKAAELAAVRESLRMLCQRPDRPGRPDPARDNEDSFF
jgi:hypothetical protein